MPWKFQDIVDSYPLFNLEDKVCLDEKGNVTGVKKEGKLVSNVVRKGGHMAADLGERKIRKDTRPRKENIAKGLLVKTVQVLLPSALSLCYSFPFLKP